MKANINIRKVLGHRLAGWMWVTSCDEPGQFRLRLTCQIDGEGHLEEQVTWILSYEALLERGGQIRELIWHRLEEAAYIFRELRHEGGGTVWFPS